MCTFPRAASLITLVMLLFLSPAFGQASGAEEDTLPLAAGLDSPRAAMFTFLDAVNQVRAGDRESITRAVGCLDRTALDGEAAAQRAARDLWSALNRIRVVAPEELPDAGGLGAEDAEYVYFPRPFNHEDEAILDKVDLSGLAIVLERQDDGAWRFSRETVAGIGDLAARLEPLERKVRVDESALELPDWLARVLPSGLMGEFVGLAYWQWLGLVLLIFVGLIVDQSARAVLRPLIRRVPRQFGGRVDDDAIGSAVRMLGLFAAAMVWAGLLPALVIGGTLEQVLLAAARAFAVLAGTFAGFRLADVAAAVAMHRAERSETKFDDVLVPLVRKTVKVFILALGIIYGAQSLYINIVPLITGLGIGGLAFAFAAKDTIENFFGSVAVIPN
jgi:MscS family membrane protein